MDLLHAAHYLEEVEKKKEMEKGNAKVIQKKVLHDVTNTTPTLPRFKCLLHGQLRRAFTPESFLTPKKKRRISTGKENADHSPKTPKCRDNIMRKAESPPTPLSNLKLLTKIASAQSPLRSNQSVNETSTMPSDENLMKKFYSEHSLVGKSVVGEPVLKKHLTYGDSSSSEQFLEPSRKEKSLGILVERFLHHFPLEISCMQTPRKIAIDDVATILSTERRRVYDIINILESLNMAERIYKNAYQWRGNQLLEDTLSRLKRLAVQWGVQSDQGIAVYHPDNLTNSITSSQDDIITKKNKSLGVLSQKFMMLLLVSPPPHIVHLDSAICFLLGHSMDLSNKNRTKGRRIYDIANVLTSLGLVKRLPQSKSFQYIGPAVQPSKEKEDIYGQLSKTRHSLLSPSQVLLSDGKSIAYQQTTLEITPSNNSRKEEIKMLGIIKAKGNCLVTASDSKEISNTVLRDIRAKNNFKVPPADKQKIKAKCLFEPRAPQIVAASKTKAITYVHPNMKNLGKSETRVALTFDYKRTQDENISPLNLKKPKFSLTASNCNYSSKPLVFVRNGSTPSQKMQPIAPEKVTGATYSNPMLAFNQHSSVSINTANFDLKRISLPSVNFNTLSKQHYKTIIGSLAKKSQTNGEGYRFVIRNNTNSPMNSLHGSNEFVKVIHHINEPNDNDGINNY